MDQIQTLPTLGPPTQGPSRRINGPGGCKRPHNLYVLRQIDVLGQDEPLDKGKLMISHMYKREAPGAPFCHSVSHTHTHDQIPWSCLWGTWTMDHYCKEHWSYSHSPEGPLGTLGEARKEGYHDGINTKDQPYQRGKCIILLIMELGILVEHKHCHVLIH